MDFEEIMLLAQARKRVRDGTSARDIRRAAGVTLADMAKALGVDESAVSRWENGNRKPRGDVAIRWAELLAELTRMSDEPGAAPAA